MAKEHKASPGLLLLMAIALLCLGWLMKSFPIFIFGGFAPLFALTDQPREDSHVWSRAELVLVALSIGFFASHIFDVDFLAVSILEAIGLTLAFLGYAFVRQRLGEWPGKITIIFFWLALEYIFLKLPWRNELVFLADAVSLKTDWLRWTSYTGYLGASLWILMANLFLYVTFLKRERVNWVFLGISTAWVSGPIVFSFLQAKPLVSRTDMIMLYGDKISSLDQNYIGLGEVISRTAAWISVLILFVAVIRNKNRK